MLKDYQSPFDATVVERFKNAGAYICGKTNMDEYGMGSYSLHSNIGPVKNINYDGELAAAGGSSGGSAVAVATEQCWTALGTDTGGSIRTPAHMTGTFGFKPSYGMLSRWGVIPYANSLDTVGILATSVGRARDTFGILSAYDPKDPTSIPQETRDRLRLATLTYGRHLYNNNLAQSYNREFRRPLRIGLLLECNIKELSHPVRQAWQGLLKEFERHGHSVKPVSIPSVQQALSAYYVIATAEASSNLAKYDGVRYGSRAEGPDSDANNVLFAKTRGQFFGNEVKKRVLLGSYSLSASAMDNYFLQAQRVRRLVQSDFDRVFSFTNMLMNENMKPREQEEEGVDVIIAPTGPMLAPTFEEIKKLDPVREYVNDVFTVPASLAGLPVIGVPYLLDRSALATDPASAQSNVLEFTPVTPRDETSMDQEGEESSGFVKKSRIPIGIQIIGQYGHEDLVLDVAEMAERWGVLNSSTNDVREERENRWKPPKKDITKYGVRNKPKK